MKTPSLYSQWCEAFAAAGLCHIGRDTARRLLAVALVYGGSSEAFTHNVRLVEDWRAAARLLGVAPGQFPSMEDAGEIRRLARELEEDAEGQEPGGDPAAKASRVCRVEWATCLMAERYGIAKLLL